MRQFIVVSLLFGRLLAAFAAGYEASIGQADIYYQPPLRLGKSQEIQLAEIEQLDSKKDIKVIVHGYLANRAHFSIVSIRNAYLAQGSDNVYTADWERAASYDYPVSRKLISKVAVRFAQLLSNFIEKHDIDPADVHLIGHSLGAHIIGIIGHYFNGTLGRLTGLDPALPLFMPKSADSLHPNNAIFVDVLHTDYPVFGDLTPRGHADFYPNYGRALQPGCNDADLITFTSCSHFRAVKLYAESILLPQSFPAVPCTLREIRFNNVKRCLRAATLNTTVLMGESLDLSLTYGQYFLRTNAASPYGQGENSDVYAVGV